LIFVLIICIFSFMRLSRLIGIFILITLFSCEQSKVKLSIATSSKGATYYQVAKVMSSTLEDEKYFLEVLYGKEYSTIKNCQLVVSKEVDLAIVQNDTPIDIIFENDSIHDHNSIRAIMPLYPEVIFIIHPDSIQTDNLKDLIKGRKIGIGPSNSGTARFMKTLFLSYGLDTTDYQPVYTSFDDNLLANPEIEISCAVTGINNSRIIGMVEKGGKIFSLDNVDLANRGSSVEGFCINYPRARPFIIPKNIYGQSPQKPILTLAVDAILITHKDTDIYEISSLVKGIYANTQSMANNNSILGFISEDFDAATLNFPLHEGVRAYLNRDEPSFFERYAELFGVILSFTVITVGSLSSLFRSTITRKKKRLKNFMNTVIDYKLQFKDNQNLDNLVELKKKVDALNIEVLRQLSSNKILDENELNIFFSQLHSLQNKLEDRIERIKKT